MAKKYLEIFRDSAETQYASGQFPLLGLAQLNKGVKFIPFAAQGDTANTVSQVAIQRFKRLTAKDVPTKTGKAATDAIALLDTAQKVTWDTVETKTSKKRSLVVNVSPFEETDPLEDASKYAEVIANKTANRLFEAEELATAKVAAVGTILTLDVSSESKAANQILGEVRKIQLLVDEFKAYSTGVAVLVHPIVADMFGKLQGQAYQMGTNTFPEGLGNGFRYQGVDFYVSPILNAIEGSAAGKVIGAIVLDKEAYANYGLENTTKEFDQMFADERFLGHTYHELDAVVDAKRIAVLEFDWTASKKVNDK